MKLENEALELGLIAKALQIISKEISYQGLARLSSEKPSAIAGLLEVAFCLAKEANYSPRPTQAFHAKEPGSSPRILRLASFNCRRISAKRCSIARRRS